ncbi:hypothetical protein, partial [Bradyrhizobium sp. SZCCHNRI1073]|uniref:hypothetical protein n=1 Tax=Bradyrhizobium sp. SZCCHNRI1073 TaxID=3057280 RepID=UPI002916EB91
LSPLLNGRFVMPPNLTVNTEFLPSLDGTSGLLLRPINATGMDVASISEKADFQQRTNRDRRRTRTPDVFSDAVRRSLSSVVARSEATTRSRTVEGLRIASLRSR